ncbi:MAG: hypothetical protein U1E51_28205 [Candidatus Binatia bacterium]|nr:hypothetical protein [Candidatus Binatia bacterium]
MNARILQPATFDPIDSWEVRVCSVEVRGVQFRSWLPKSALECAKINTEANDIVRRAEYSGDIKTEDFRSKTVKTMSSTNRGSVRSPSDFYATPEEAFAPLLTILPMDKALLYWEPACGDRRLIEWIYAAGGLADGRDLRTDGIDFLKDETPRSFIITNPPFSLAFEFCQHAVAHAPEVMLLLRLNFLASKKRAAWFKANEPSALFVLSKRPDFTGGGGDSCDYAWFYFGNRFTGIHHL